MKPGWYNKVTEPSKESKRRWPSSIERAWISLLRFPEAIVRRKTVIRVRNCKEACSRGSHGALVSEQRTQAKSHLGVSKRETGRLSFMARITSEMDGSAQTCDDLRKANVCEIIDLYHLMELRERFLSSKRYMKKSAMRLGEGLRGSIFPRIHKSEKSFQRAS